MKAFIKQLLRGLFSALGYKISLLPSNPDSLYSVVVPAATYSPWNKDVSFRQIYQTLLPYTLVDEYRCYELWQLVGQSAKLSRGSIIEIGVRRGGTGVLLAQRAKSAGITDKVFLCDTFAGVVKAGTMDTHYRGGEHADAPREMVEKLIQKTGLDNVEILEGIFPDESARKVEGLQFRLCHIDVDVYQSAKDVMDWIWPRMVPGGMIIYDDYGFSTCDGITKYVNEQFSAKDRLIVHNLNGHAIVIKLWK